MPASAGIGKVAMGSARNDRRPKDSPVGDIRSGGEIPAFGAADDHVLGFDIREILIGAIDPGADLALLQSRFADGGGDRDDFIVLDGQRGLDQLRSHGGRAGPMRTVRHIMRHLDGLDADATGHVLATAEADLTAGSQVIVLRGVARQDAPRLAALLKDGGVAHTHYVGSWTTIEDGGVPTR